MKEGVNDLRLKDYQGARKAGAIVSHIAELIPNHVTRVTDAKFNDFLSENNETAKAILFTNKGATTPLWKSLAIDYLGIMGFAQIRDKEKRAVEAFRITKYPTIVLLPGGDAEGIVYEGSGFSKDALLKFFQTTVPLTEETSSTEPSGKETSSSAQESKTATTKETPTPKRKCYPSIHPHTHSSYKSLTPLHSKTNNPHSRRPRLPHCRLSPAKVKDLHPGNHPLFSAHRRPHRSIRQTPLPQSRWRFQSLHSLS